MTRHLLFAISFFLFASGYCPAQTSTNSISKKPIVVSTFSAAKASPAYAELLLRRTERESELEELLLNYTDEFPKVKEIRIELDSIQQEMKRVLATSDPEAGKLTLALGKLMLRKIELQTDLWKLRQQYSSDHPDVIRQRRKIEIFEKAIKEIIP